MRDLQTKPYYVQRIPVLSTAHITPETNEALQQMASAGPGDVAALGDGFMVFIGSADRDAERFSDLPADIRLLAEWCDAEGFTDNWLRLDGTIGDAIEGLPTYDW